MEIPPKLKSLYRHWSFHTNKPIPSQAIDIDYNVLNEIIAFMTERMRIWEKKENNEKPHFTNDATLQKFKFCNIYRELDRQTIEFHTLLNPLRGNFNLWLLNMLFCRLVCNPETIRQVGLLSFNENSNKKVFEKLKNLRSPKYGTAYIFPISLIQRSQYPTREEFFCFYLPKVISQIADHIILFSGLGVNKALEKILPIFGFNLRFHWTEVLIDLGYQFPQYICLFKRFPVGPGSLPTMRLLNNSMSPEDTCLSLKNVYLDKFPYLEFGGEKVYLSTENWEGIGCEFRKYMNLKSGNGRRRLYKYS